MKQKSRPDAGFFMPCSWMIQIAAYAPVCPYKPMNSRSKFDNLLTAENNSRGWRNHPILQGTSMRMIDSSVKGVAVAVALAAVVGVSGCGKKDEGAIKIGHAGPLTGSIAHLGKDNENGVRLALDEANTAGVEIGGKKVKFELLSEDDQADPKQGTIVAQKLVDAKVAGIVGHLNSGTTIPASKLYSDAGIPQISPSATNPKYTLQGFKT